MKVSELPIDMQVLLAQIAADAGMPEEDLERLPETDLPVRRIPVKAFPDPLKGRPDGRGFESYAATPIEDYPPLVVAHGYFIDGRHRLYAAIRQGAETVRAIDASAILDRNFVVKNRGFWIGPVKEPRPVPPELDLATNLWGRLTSQGRARIMSLLENPSQKTWDDAHGIILDRQNWLTLWQAILAVEPTFPARGKATDQKGRVVEPWPRIPEPELVLRALRYATH